MSPHLLQSKVRAVTDTREGLALPSGRKRGGASPVLISPAVQSPLGLCQVLPEDRGPEVLPEKPHIWSSVGLTSQHRIKVRAVCLQPTSWALTCQQVISFEVLVVLALCLKCSWEHAKCRIPAAVEKRLAGLIGLGRALCYVVLSWKWHLSSPRTGLIWGFGGRLWSIRQRLWAPVPKEQPAAPPEQNGLAAQGSRLEDILSSFLLALLSPVASPSTLRAGRSTRGWGALLVGIGKLVNEFEGPSVSCTYRPGWRLEGLWGSHPTCRALGLHLLEKMLLSIIRWMKTGNEAVKHPSPSESSIDDESRECTHEAPCWQAGWDVLHI